MSYDSSRLVSVSFPITTANVAHNWRASGSGHLYDIQLSTVTSWVGTTSPLLVEVGIVGDLDKFGELRAGAAGAGTPAGWPLSARLDAKKDISEVVTHADFKRGDAVIITVTGPVGGPAGAGQVTVTFQVDP